MDFFGFTRRDLMLAAGAATLPALLPCGARSEGDVDTISYVRAASASDIDAHASFGWEVLAEVLERTRATHGDYRLTVSPDPTQALRFRHATRNADVQVNTVILTVSPVWNDVLLPVRIPFQRGLLGYRLLLIHRADLDRFARIKSLADLRQITFGSVDHWTDTTILRTAGLPVITGSTYDGLLKMMQAHRFDTLTHGVHEIEFEMAKIEQDPANDIVVEPHLLLHYVLPLYFWFSKDTQGQQRAERVRAGLKAMIADGSLEKMFDARFGAVIAKYELAKRTVIELPDPVLKPEDPIDDARLWYRP
jgi:ABC-type amino acid transport substrate-binding protein